MVLFNFLSFIAIFLEFSIMPQVGTERNDNFSFLPFSSSFNLWWLQMKPYWHFLFFWIFLQFFWNFKFCVIFSLSNSFPNYFGLKSGQMWFFNFLNFFAIFLEISIKRRVGTEQNDNFYFLSFLAFSKLFWLEMMP